MFEMVIGSVLDKLDILGTGENTTSTEALWALRDFMMHEALGVVKIM